MTSDPSTHQQPAIRVPSLQAAWCSYRLSLRADGWRAIAVWPKPDGIGLGRWEGAPRDERLAAAIDLAGRFVADAEALYSELFSAAVAAHNRVENFHALSQAPTVLRKAKDATANRLIGTCRALARGLRSCRDLVDDVQAWEQVSLTEWMSEALKDIEKHRQAH